MAYAGIIDIQDWIGRELSPKEQERCEVLLSGAAAIIDSYKTDADENTKKYVSCQMVMRIIGTEPSADNVTIGATQGSISALGYSQSWTMSGGASGELYLSKTEKRMLGVGNSIGSRSPVQDLVPEVEP